MVNDTTNSADINALPEEKAKAYETQNPDQAVVQPAVQTATPSTHPSKPKKTRGTAAKVIALALCCSLVGGAVGAGSVICLSAFCFRPDRKIAAFKADGPVSNRNRDDRKDRQKGDGNGRGSSENRERFNGGRRDEKGSGQQFSGNRDQHNGSWKGSGSRKHSQGGSGQNKKDQGTDKQPDKGSDNSGNTQTPSGDSGTQPSNGGDEKTKT